MNTLTVNDIPKYANLKVFHNDCEWGMSLAEFSLMKVIDVPLVDYQGNIKEAGYKDCHDEDSIKNIRERVVAFESRNLHEEYDGHLGWATVGDYIEINIAGNNTDIETLKRIDAAEYSIIVSGS